nr:hypothetical protein [Tanacetum cinerariifolium]
RSTKIQFRSIFVVSHIITLQRLLSVLIILKDPASEFSTSGIKAWHSYKLGVDQLERRLAEYKEREVKYIETIRSLERDKECNLRKINKLTSDVETLQEEKDVVDGKLARLIKSLKILKISLRVRDLSWTGLPEFADDTVTDYSRPSPTVESTSTEGQNKISTTAENGESTDSILSKHAVKFVKEGDKPAERPTTNKAEFVKAAERPTTDKV